MPFFDAKSCATQYEWWALAVGTLQSVEVSLTHTGSRQATEIRLKCKNEMPYLSASYCATRYEWWWALAVGTLQSVEVGLSHTGSRQATEIRLKCKN